MKPLLLLVVVAASPQDPDAYAAGARALAERRFDEALRIYVAAEKDAGADASAEAAYDVVLAALGGGRLADAAAAAKRATARDGGRFAGLEDFVAGADAFRRARSAALLAESEEAEPFAFDAAIAAAERARAAWIAAATRRADWPEARRNVARATALVEAFRARKAERERARKSESRPAPPKRPPEPPPAKPDAEERAEERPRPVLERLSPEELKRLSERLAALERAKRDLRRARRAADERTERDW